MKSILKIAIVFMLFGISQYSEAQFFKKMKDKTTKVLSGKKEVKEDSKNPTYGSVVLTHSNTFKAVNISEVGKIKVERTDENYNVTGSWRTHDADIADGFILRLKTKEDLRHDTNSSDNVKRTFSIPEEATLKLSYDPQLVHYNSSNNNYVKAVSEDYQSYEVSKGQVTVDVLDKDNIQISFNGKVTLKKVERSRDSAEDDLESYLESSIKGGIDATGVEYYDNLVGFYESPKEETLTIATHNSFKSKPGIYQFSFETIAEITSSEDNRTYKMSYLLNPNESYVGIKADMSEYSNEELDGESVIVMDSGKAHIFVETNGMKIRMSPDMMGGQQMQNPTEQMADYDYANLKKTGNTKTVLGAKCHEYTMSDKDVKMNLWVAPDINLPNWFIQSQEVVKGHILEYTITSKDGNMTSKTIAINDNILKEINPIDYKKMF